MSEVISPAAGTGPTVPTWVGYFGLGARRAGRMGVGLLSALPWCLEPYLQGLVEGGHDPTTARMTGGLDLIVSEDPEPNPKPSSIPTCTTRPTPTACCGTRSSASKAANPPPRPARARPRIRATRS